MAEVTTSNSTATQCSLPTKKARMEQETVDAFKCKGSLIFRIDNFRELSNSPPGKASMRQCIAKVSVRGLTFGLAVYPVRCVTRDEKKEKCICMGTIVKCENDSGCTVNGDDSWNCLANMTFRVKTLLKSSADLLLIMVTHKFFSSKAESSLEWNSKISWRFDYLMDPNNSLYNEKENTLELITEISADAPVGIMELPKMDIIQVNKETVMVNKSQLAMHSRYFHTMFYNGQYTEGQSGEYKLEIGAPATVEHFKRMLQTMYPENRPLDDECIEGVLHLANQFLVNIVEGKCLEFLREKSTKSALFKYRMADKYGCAALENHVLTNLGVADFKDNMFKTNMAEYNQLGSTAADALMARYDELFSSGGS